MTLPWDTTLLGAVASVVMGQSPPSTTYNSSGDGLPFLQGKAEFGDRSPTPVKFCARPLRVAQQGSVLVSVRAPVGDSNIADREYCIGRGLAALIPKRVLDAEFLLAWLQLRRKELDACGSGTTFRSINRDVLEQFQVPLPSLSEQRAIATVLRTVAQAKDSTEKVIAATRQLKQSLLNHLFTYGPVPFDEANQVSLKETEIGALPRHWSTTRLGEHALIGNGSTPKRTESRYWDGGTIPWLTSGKVHEGTIRAADEFVTEAARHECHLPVVPKESLVVAITGQGKTLGNAAILAIDACVSQHLAYVTLNGADLVPAFVLAFLRSRYDQLQAASRGGGSTKGALTCGFLKLFEIPFPSLSEQRAIAWHLSVVDARIAAEEGRSAALVDLSRSLLRHLLTGEVRLPEFANAQQS